MTRHVSVDVTSLTNVRADEDVDEPYVLIGAIVLDATTVQLDLDAYLHPRDEHWIVHADNVELRWLHVGRGQTVPDDVPQGATAAIPIAYGHLDATLKPLRLQPFPDKPAAVVPGMVLLYAQVMEEDATPESVIGRVQLLAQPDVDELVRAFLKGLGGDVFSQPNATRPDISFQSPEYAAALATRLSQDFLTTVLPKIKDRVRKIGKGEGLYDVFAGNVAGIDRDDDVGSALWVVPSADSRITGLAGRSSLPVRQVSGDGIRYDVAGTYSWSAAPDGLMRTEYTFVGWTPFGFPVTRALEGDAGACGRAGDRVTLTRMAAEETYAVHVPGGVDEFEYRLRVDGALIGAAGDGRGARRGNFTAPGPATWMDLDSTGTWPSKKVVKQVRPACAWHIDPNQVNASGGFTLNIHRLSTDPQDPHPSLSLDIDLVVIAGDEELVVESQTLVFRPMTIHNPVIECLVAAGQFIARDDLDGLQRPPWMDPPDKEPDGPADPGVNDKPIEIARPGGLGPLPRPPVI